MKDIKEIAVSEFKREVRKYLEYLWVETGTDYDNDLKREFNNYKGCWNNFAEEKVAELFVDRIFSWGWIRKAIKLYC